MRIVRKTMILLIAAAIAADYQGALCPRVNMAQDDVHAVERRGWKDGKPEVADSIDLFGSTVAMSGPTAPDVSATDIAMRFRTKEDAPVMLFASHSRGGCLSFGDTVAFEAAYADADIGKAFVEVTVNGKIVGDAAGNSLFEAHITDLTVDGLRHGDVIDVLVLTEGWQTVSRCREIPTITDQGGTETVCDRGYQLWERREYVY